MISLSFFVLFTKFFFSKGCKSLQILSRHLKKFRETNRNLKIRIPKLISAPTLKHERATRKVVLAFVPPAAAGNSMTKAYFCSTQCQIKLRTCRLHKTTKYLLKIRRAHTLKSPLRSSSAKINSKSSLEVLGKDLQKVIPLYDSHKPITNPGASMTIMIS